MEKVKRGVIESGAASFTLPGQSVSGDLYLVKTTPNGELVAVVDGLGHGEEAAAAARIAIRSVEASAGQPLITLVKRCHEALRLTRGVVMSLAAFNAVESTLTWLGVGNVEGFLLHQSADVFPEQDGLLLRAGVVGDQLPNLTASIVQISEGDLLIFATDGVRPNFVNHVNLSQSPQQIADRILVEYGKGGDDALVLAARYVNGQVANALR